MNEEDALTFVLRLMTSAAEFDSATGGVDAQAQLVSYRQTHLG